MIERLKSAPAALLGFVLERPKPVLMPYHRRPTALASTIRHLVGLVAITFLGMVYGFYFALLPLSFLIYLLLPIVIMALAAIWMLPDRDVAPPKAIERLFFAFFIMMIIWPNYLAIAISGLPWISMRRLLMAPMLIIFLVSLSTSPKMRAELAETLNAIPLIWKMLAGFIVIQIMSFVMVGNFNASFKWWLNRQIFWLGSFFIGAYIFIKPGQIARWSRILLLLAIAVSLIGLWEYQEKHVLWADHIPSFLRIDNDAVLAALAGNTRLGFYYRPISTFANPLIFGEFVALATPFAVHMMITSKAIWRQIIGAMIAALFLTTSIYTGARLALVGTIVGYAVYTLLWGIRRWRLAKMDLIGPAVVMAYPALMAFTAIAVTSIGRIRTAVLGNGATAASDAARDAQWHKIWPALEKSPLFGYGPATSGNIVGVALPDGTITVDSHFLTMLSEYGVGGFLLYYGMFCLATYTTAKLAIEAGDDEEQQYAIPIAATLCAFLVLRYVLSQEDNNALEFMILGIVTAFCARKKVTDSLLKRGERDA